jgi:DNA repair protein RadC
MQITLRELIHEYNKGEEPKISTAEDIYKECKEILNMSKEVMVAFYLDTKSKVMAREIISVGILNASLIHPREVFRSAIFCNANSIIIAHNHPSDDHTPSGSDTEVTKLLFKAGELLGIELLDHVVVSTSGYTSSKEAGLMK